MLGSTKTNDDRLPFSLDPQTGSSIFGGSSDFGQKAAYYPFGSAIRPSQPASGSQPAFGSTEAPCFWCFKHPTFGATSTPAFGATSASAFGATNPLKATGRPEARLFTNGDKGSGRIPAFELNKEKFEFRPPTDYRDGRSYVIRYDEKFHGGRRDPDPFQSGSGPVTPVTPFSSIGSPSHLIQPLNYFSLST